MKTIDFADQFVPLIESGRKTQTRRLMKVQPPNDGQKWRVSQLIESTCRRSEKKNEGKHHWVVMSDDLLSQTDSMDIYFEPPHGYVGDRLWVRETFIIQDLSWKRSEHPDLLKNHFAALISYKSDYSSKIKFVHIENWRCDYEIKSDVWRSPVTMPRWASRITLEITNVRAERIRDVSDDDAIAEGIKKFHLPFAMINGIDMFAISWPNEICGETPREAFFSLWESIYPGSWKRNDWVWVYEFEVRTKPCL